jgi:outer membrane protein assembly factor BamB
MKQTGVTILVLAAVLGSGVGSGNRPGGIGKPSLRPPFKRLWRFPVTHQMEGFSLAHGAVCFGTSLSYGAVSLTTGKLLWEQSIPGVYVHTHLTADGQVVYVAVRHWKLLACDLKTGRRLWDLPIRGDGGVMAAEGDTLFCELQPGVLTALATSTGVPRWTHRLVPVAAAEGSAAETSLQAATLVMADGLIGAADAGEVFCLNSRSAQIRWRISFETWKDGSVTALAYDHKRVYLTMHRRGVVALSIDTGKRIWRSLARVWIAGPPALIGHTALFATVEGMLYGVNAVDGRVRWQRVVSRLWNPEVWPPIASAGQVLVSADTKLLSFDAAGNTLWEWDTEERSPGEPVAVLPDSVLLASASHFSRFAMGQPPALPGTIAGRQALAKELVARFDHLDEDEQHTLLKLGDEAFEALLPLVRVRLAQQHPEQFSNPLKALAAVMQPKHTPAMIALLSLTDPPRGDPYARLDLFGILAFRGDDRALSLFLDQLRIGPQWAGFDEALYFVTHSSHPDAVRFLIEQLGNPQADPIIRHEAFINLARTGGAAGLKAVLAARDKRRTIPSLAQFMAIDRLGTTAASPQASFGYPVRFPSQLLDTRKDSHGVLWGLIESGALGSLSDLWIARHNGKQWINPLFTGMTAEQLGHADWFARFVGNPKLSQDTDRDGWTDLVEQRLGTDPSKADTDGDGLPESRDKNPLVAPRPLSESEQVLAVAFEARFRFTGSRDVPCLVELPKGIRPLDLSGWDWIIITLKAGDDLRLAKMAGRGVAVVSFSPPVYDFTGGAVHGRGVGQEQVILWNGQHTEAKLGIHTFYSGLDGDSDDIRLRKFGAHWVVIEAHGTGVS